MLVDQTKDMTENDSIINPELHYKVMQKKKGGEHIKFDKEFKYIKPKTYRSKIIKLIKSIIRITGYGLLVFDITVGVVVLILGEVFGLYEDLV